LLLMFPCGMRAIRQSSFGEQMVVNQPLSTVGGAGALVIISPLTDVLQDDTTEPAPLGP
jgi:hypothetical protein